MIRKITNILYVLVLLLFVTEKANAQLASGIPHTFSAVAGVPALPGGTINLVPALATQNEWDTLVDPAAAWSFNFAGTTYDKFLISSNGWLALIPGSVPPPVWPAFLLPPNPTNQLNNNTTGYPIIAPLWDDNSTSLARYAVAGNILWVVWTSKWQSANAASLTFFVSLDGNTNTIKFYYQNTAYTQTAGSTASIGISGVCVGDFYSVYSTAATTAYVDSVTENTNIGTNAVSPNIRPQNVTYTFTPNLNDACANAKDLGVANATCTFKTYSTGGATTSGSPTSCAADVKDVWFKFVKPAGASGVTVSTAPATCLVVGTTVEVYDACGGASLGCSTTSGANANYGEVTIARPCAAETLWVRVTTDGDVPGKFQLCAIATGLGSNSGVDCATANLVCNPLPFHANGLTTQGSVNNYGDSVLCTSTYMRGEDYILTFTPAVTQCVNIWIDGTGANSYPGLFVTSGCPSDTANSLCIGSATNVSNGDSIMNLTLTGGQTYYIIVDNNATLAGTNFMPFNFHMTASASAAPPNDNCASAANLGNVNIGANCFWSSTYNTQCATPTLTAPNPGCPGFNNTLINDVWLYFTPTFTGNLVINTQGAGANPMIHGGMALYSGTCGSLFALACSGDSVNIPFMPSLSVPVTAGIQYYIRVWSNAGYDPGSFQVCFVANCAPPNDLPVNHIPIPLNVPVLGDNTCSTGLQEPPPLGCTHDGVNVPNTVWYSVVFPPSGNLAVRFVQESLSDVAAAAYLFPTGPANANAGNHIELDCNDDLIFAAPTDVCGMTGDNDAILAFSGTPGTTAYIAVDGAQSWVGTFWITAIDGDLLSVDWPAILGKDCENPYVLCDNGNWTTLDGGVGSAGNVCDFKNFTACTPQMSEVGSFWMKFTVTAGSEVGFTITPNDSATPIADYNFYIFDITTTPSICGFIRNGTVAPPIRCNTIAGTGKTGLRNPAAGPFSSNIAAVGANRTYLMVILNKTSANDDEGAPGTQTGFVLNWDIWSGGVNTGVKTQLYGVSPYATWAGPVINTDYENILNWKGLANCPPPMPSCTTDVFINNASQQCWVMTGNSYAKNVTINAGGTLYLQAGANLHVCGDFINNGTLLAQLGSTVTFEGSGAQTIAGALTGANAFASVVINKTNPTLVTIQNNIDCKEHFTTSNATSIFSINGKYMKVGGHFTNHSSPTFIGTGGSTVEFNGTGNQNYTNTNGQDTLNNVKMDKPSGKLYLNSSFSNLIIDSVLTLSRGIIVTSLAQEVNLRWQNVGAVTSYSTNSYINGKLRRKIINFLLNPTGLDFPLGDSLVPNIASGNGYNLANIKFSSSTTIPDLVGWFLPWPGAVPNGPLSNECVYATYDILPILNNGYWTFQKTSAFFGGAYEVSLYNTGFNNNIGSAGWTVAKAGIADAPLVPASWTLIGQCYIPSTVAMTRRVTLNTPATAGTSFNHLYATVQSTQPLPIELLYFNAEPVGEKVICRWETSSEINNDYFEVERSDNGKSFEVIGKVSGFGAGISSESRTYSITDADQCNTTRYYRLKQVDIDGRDSYSETVAVNCKSAGEIDLYPNPANTDINYQFHYTENTVLTVNILDVYGRVVYNENVNVQKGMNSLSCKIDELASGAYYISISNPVNSTVKLQKQFFKN
jgi:hypothetical protein